MEGIASTLSTVFYLSALLQEHIFELENTLGVVGEALPLYVIYPDETSGDWRVQAVPVSPDSFESRKALPVAWRALRDDSLSLASGVEGCIFVHASGFIGGKTVWYPILHWFSHLMFPGTNAKESALELARRALLL